MNNTDKPIELAHKGKLYILDDKCDGTIKNISGKIDSDIQDAATELMEGSVAEYMDTNKGKVNE